MKVTEESTTVKWCMYHVPGSGRSEVEQNCMKEQTYSWIHKSSTGMIGRIVFQNATTMGRAKL